MDDTEDSLILITIIIIYINWISLLLVIIGVIGNCMICYIIVHNKDLHRPIYFYLISLAVCDTLNCIVWFLMILDYGIISFENIFEDVIFSFNIFIVPLVTVYTTTALTVERYIAVCHPLKAKHMSSKSRTVKIIVTIWITTLVTVTAIVLDSFYSILPQFITDILDPESTYILFIVTPPTVILVLYILIGLSVWRSKRLACRIADTSSSREEAANKSIGISVVVVLELFICLVPWQLNLLVGFYISEDFYGIYLFVTKFLNIVSCLIDPLVYSLVSTEFRKAFKNVYSLH